MNSGISKAFQRVIGAIPGVSRGFRRSQAVTEAFQWCSMGLPSYSRGVTEGLMEGGSEGVLQECSKWSQEVLWTLHGGSVGFSGVPGVF